MGIDWVTVAAQAVNFLILVWLLKRFLFGPVTKAIAARETEIASRVADVAQTESDAKKCELSYQDKIADLERQKSAYLTAAQEGANRTRQELERKARLEIEASATEWRRRLEAEHAGYLTELRDRAAFSIVNLTRQALTDLADETLEAQIERQFEHRIRALAPDMAEAFRVSDGNAPVGTISTRFPLSETLRASILRTVSEAVGGEVVVEFEEDVAGSPGIVLKIAGLRVGWTIDTYLNALEADIVAYLKNPSTEQNAEQ